MDRASRTEARDIPELSSVQITTKFWDTLEKYYDEIGAEHIEARSEWWRMEGELLHLR